jgi:hypothetical protein
MEADMQCSEIYELHYRKGREATNVEEYETWDEAKDEFDRMLKSRNYSYGSIHRVTTVVNVATFSQTVV